MESNFNSCPVCREQSNQCWFCASYVIDGERIYYEKLNNFGAVKEHEIRFINRIQKHTTTAFFHNGKLYIPSRQGRVVPLAIGLQWEAWQEQQMEVDKLRKQIDEVSQNLIEKAKKDAKKTNQPHASHYFLGIAEGLDTFRHSIGLSDDSDKAMRGNHE